ncbi:hypothetical protein PXH59_00800 [Xenorhabdus sp. SF857]|uniref:hypothetical protein n=1 Tax=Xenorhabdus bakwenae TaxID=3026967 RepID=UPI002557D40A|nr:hypothetical protein [Xenorhabdus sp. SF857]WFQ79779.1 hypothetical protein PXH59_00750 [Xenorhabdus sp. SF857]WFQ79789.1 hypothetical protein PXH59_00800 [Xenorhabdus sp. SF857]
MPDYRRKPLCSIAPLFLIDGVINLILCSFSLSATGERGPACRAAGGRSAGAGGKEPASGALRRSQALRLRFDTVSWEAPCSREAPCGGCTGRRWRARERARREATASRAQ